MDLNIVNQRVDRALADNQRAQNIVLLMSASIFAMGILVLLVAYWQKNPYVGGGAMISQGFLYWPMQSVLKVRRDNVILQTFPVLISGLDPEPASKEIIKFLAYLRGH